MSICSDVFITKEKAKEMVRRRLLAQHEILIDQAIKGMENWDLTMCLNENSDIYFYNIEQTEEQE